MLTPLRSKKMMIFLSVVVVVALVLTGGIGLFRALSTNPVAAPPPQDGQEGHGQEEAPEPLEAPEVDALGQAPAGLTYTSDDEDVHCNPAECVRLVQVLPEEEEGAEVGSEKTIEQVYDHLLDQDWGQLLPEGVEEPADVPLSETMMTDGDVLVADSSEHGGSDSVAVLMLGNANQPAS